MNANKLMNSLLTDHVQKGVKVAELSYDEFIPWKIRANLPSKVDYEIRRRGADRKVEIWTSDIAAADLIDKAIKKSLKGGG